GYLSTVTAGTSHNFTITAHDAYGNTATGYTGTLTFTSTDVKAVLPAIYKFASTDSGVHSFSATLKTTGSQSITATDPLASTIKGSQSVITLTRSASSGLGVTDPCSITASQAVIISFAAVGAFSNVISCNLGAFHFPSSDPIAILPSNYTFSAADAGAH